MRQRDDLVFPMSEYERRLAELRARMRARELDAVLLSTPENICYLTGFESLGLFWFQAVVVPLAGEPFAFVRQLETRGYEVLTWLEHVLSYQDSDDIMAKLADTLGAFDLRGKRIGIEQDCWFFTSAQQQALLEHCPDTAFVNASGLVEAGRVIKSELEIDLMRHAARTAEAGLQAGIDALEDGVSEDHVAAEMHYAMIEAGSHWPAISPFVASGERGAIGHATWAGRQICKGDAVFLEVGGCRHRYHAAIMRTCFVGEPAQEMKEAFAVVLQAFDVAMAAIKPGVAASEVDRVAREFIAASEFGGTQASRTAYSMGIAFPPDWGEGHILSMKPGETRPLQANMTFHLLPWVQIPGKGGIGCTETVRVTEGGCESLTQFLRELFVK